MPPLPVIKSIAKSERGFKMKKISGYKNYGCLAAEKIVVFTIDNPNPTATVSDKVEIEIPGGWDVWENEYGSTMLTSPWGWEYKADEVIDRAIKAGEEIPCLAGYDKEGNRFRINLKCE